jgi:hypothetical protein
MKDQKSPGKGAEGQPGKSDPKAAQGERKGQMDRKSEQGDRGKDKKAADTQRQQDQKKSADTERQQRDQKKAADTDRQRDQKKAADTDRQQRDQKKAADTDRQRQDKKAADQQRQPGDRDQKAAQGDQKRGDQQRVQVSDQQRTTVREQIKRDRNVERISRSRLNVNINVGVAIPRSMRLHTLPVTLVSTVPAYRGYSYIVLEDDTICIVDPRTYVIVDVIDAGGGMRADRGGARLTLAQEDMRFIYRTLPKERRANVRIQMALGAEVPRDVELYEFPAEVVERVPDVRRYRYVVVEDDIVIVDPSDHQVSLVINE